MKTLEELAKIREMALAKAAGEALENHVPKFIVTIGMATCGITAGARPVFTALLECMTKDKTDEVKVLQTGCFGKCDQEPMIKLETAGGHVYYYGGLDSERMVAIYQHHMHSEAPLKAYIVEME